MADLLISGVDLPERGEILCLFSDGSLGLLDADYGFYPVRPIDCAKAVSLPEGHWRLVDADAFEDAFIRYYLSQERSNHLVFTPVEIKQHLADMIADFPTIVPAEGGTEDGN